jgi:hypothetical protein
MKFWFMENRHPGSFQSPLAKATVFFVVVLFSLTWAQSEVPQSLQFQGTSYTAYDKGAKLWEIRAAKVYGNQKIMKGFRIHGIIYESATHLKPKYFLESPMASFNLTSNDVLFPRGATLLSPKGERVHVGVLLWDALKKRFVGTKGVEVVRLNSRLQGDEMVLKQGFKDLILKGHVKAWVKSKP